MLIMIVLSMFVVNVITASLKHSSNFIHSSNRIQFQRGSNSNNITVEGPPSPSPYLQVEVHPSNTYKSESCLQVQLQQIALRSLIDQKMCHLQRSQEDDIIQSMNEEQHDVTAMAIAKWSHNRINYKIANYPLCTTLTDADVRDTIREAVQTWNSIEGVNILLEEYIGSDEADITISFLPCYHNNITGLDNDPNFDCQKTFAHAFYPPVGDIHLNTGVMWSDSKRDNTDGSNPSLYSIVLHELGHSFGLGHNSNPDSVMYRNFNGSRAYHRLELHAEDIADMIKNYPIIADDCRDDYYYPNTCPKSFCQIESFIYQCRLTCGLCDPTECKDAYIKCSQDISICNDHSTNLRQYCRKTCEMCSECKPPNILNGLTIPDRVSYFSKDRVEFRCLSGYKLVGLSTGVCEEGRWSPIPKCERDKDCYDLLQTCSKKKLEGRCSTMKKKMMLRCKKTCGFC